MSVSWDAFLAAEVGASAALAGLIFVGVSINMNKIISYPRLVGRALQAMTVLVAALVVSSLYLVPGQSDQLYGAEVLATGVVAWALNSRVDVKSVRTIDRRYRRANVFNVALSQAAAIPYVVAGGVSIAFGDAGLYWLVPAIMLSLVKAIADAWVLLVEVNR